MMRCYFFLGGELQNFLINQKFRNIKKKLSIKAKAAGVVTEEDVFKAVS